jgi:putative oxidoreductase
MFDKLFSFLDKYRDAGILILRIGLGAMFIYHGTPKIIGGPDQWIKLGGAIKSLGIPQLAMIPPVFWGLMSAIAEFGGGIMLISGFMFRPACMMLTVNMFVATMMHFKGGDGLQVASHAIEDGIVFFSLILIGPGKYTVR